MKKRKARDRVRVLKSKVVFRGPVFYVSSDMVKEPAGMEVRRDMIRHPGSVGVLLARQYRYAAGERLWELPAGRIDAGESELAAAKRELLEETGYTARRWSRAMFFYVSPGFLDETMAIYMARDLRLGAAQPEEDEVIAKRL